MFDWFWEFLYLLTKSIFRLIDGLISCTNYLCGIEPVKINGTETDLITWLVNTEEVKTGFIVASLVSITLIVFFSVWGIIKAVTSEKQEMTPGQICVKAFKSFLTFLFMPFIMVVLIWAFNTIGQVLYAGTNGGSTHGLGTFLVGAFSQDALNAGVSSTFYCDPGFDYTNTDLMWSYVDLSDFDYFYSWVAGIAILFMMTKVLLIFVDRLFSLIILYIISPIPIATSVVDDGQIFKQWREQIIGKFVVGYGAIIGFNIYSIVVAKLATSDIEFFGVGFIDFLFKIIIILGGTFALNKIITLVGNIFAKGQADQDLQNAYTSAQGVKSFGSGMFALASKPLGAVGGFLKNKLSGGKGGDKGNTSGGNSGSGTGAKSNGDGTSNKNPMSGSLTPGGSLAPNSTAQGNQGNNTVANVIENKGGSEQQLGNNGNKNNDPVNKALNTNTQSTIGKKEENKK